MGRSSGRFSFVSAAVSKIHHLPRISTKLRPISKATKFFSRMGHSASKATISPLRTREARARSVRLDELSASRMKVSPASTRTSVMTMRSNFERGRITNARSLSMSASQVKSAPGAMHRAERRSFEIEP